ncbi:hypothetical protein Tco_0257773 [Tanacetum coccineum]
MTIPTLLMLLESHSLSNKTPVKISRKVLHKLTTIVVTCMVIRYMESFVNGALSCKRRKKKSELRKIKWLKIDIEDTIYYDDGRGLLLIAITRPVSANQSVWIIKSSVENLVLIPSESEGIPDSVCDVPLCNNPTPLEAFKEHSETIIDSNNDYSSTDDDSYEKIDYVDASPPDAEIVSIEASSSTSLNLFLEETNTFDNSSPESETFCFDLEENSSGSTTTRSDYSLPDYEAFYLMTIY